MIPTIRHSFFTTYGYSGRIIQKANTPLERLFTLMTIIFFGISHAPCIITMAMNYDTRLHSDSAICFRTLVLRLRLVLILHFSLFMLDQPVFCFLFLWGNKINERFVLDIYICTASRRRFTHTLCSVWISCFNCLIFYWHSCCPSCLLFMSMLACHILLLRFENFYDCICSDKRKG